MEEQPGGVAVLGALTASEANLIFLILALCGFALALYLASVRNYVGAVLAAVISVVILLVGL